ncbi:hypothetical protein EJ05DRAFT_504288 [Pseudovirgaria hyperparasitica]|uniref:Uncharacterized protein n=1 Tax=Pseudovirgaria hyperparasitica TaxID=470096 RepID=A0A6A6VWL3_9PEZI|nr:uncharacterized protein EJ05DRAFT_504288 [Pseudovirgaria hyperparasitica]KAF2754186.1 hypothetical protein EJ05DRAFT_504288 [Pseudovirgaria hyperparasitica]
MLDTTGQHHYNGCKRWFVVCSVGVGLASASASVVLRLCLQHILDLISLAFYLGLKSLTTRKSKTEASLTSGSLESPVLTPRTLSKLSSMALTPSLPIDRRGTAIQDQQCRVMLLTSYTPHRSRRMVVNHSQLLRKRSTWQLEKCAQKALIASRGVRYSHGNAPWRRRDRGRGHLGNVRMGMEIHLTR